MRLTRSCLGGALPIGWFLLMINVVEETFVDIINTYL